jgi:hypothetical protein
MLFKSTVLCFLLALDLTILTTKSAEAASHFPKDFDSIVIGILQTFQTKLEKSKLTREDEHILYLLYAVIERRRYEVERQEEDNEYWHLRQGR